MSEAVLACLERLAGQSISVAVSTVGSEDGLLDPEHEAVLRAVQKRRAEFAAGRRAARLALRGGGHNAVAIPQNAHRAPVWPEGLVGSLSHDNGLAIAGVARLAQVRALGLDLAEADDFPAHLRDQVLRTPREKQQSGLEARLNFSAKESVFKAFYPMVQEYFGFDAVEVLPDMEAGLFDVRLRRTLGSHPEGAPFQGRFAIVERRLVTLLAIPA